MVAGSGQARGIDARIFALAIPAVGALAADPLLSLADTAFVARLGPEALAALGINGAIFGFAFVVFNFLAYVTTPLVARAMGADDRPEAMAVISRALILGGVLGVAASLLLWILAPQLLDLMQTGAEVRSPAMSYLQIRAWAAPAVLVTLAAHGSFRGLADTRTPLVVALVVNVINIVLNPILIFGLGMGVAGSALASLVAQYLGAAMLIRSLQRRVGAFSFTEIRWTSFANLLRPAGWVTMRTLMLVFTLAATTATASSLGTAQLAAHQVVRETWFLSAMVVDGLAIAAQTLVAAAGGRLDFSDEANVIRRLLFWGTVIGVVLTGLWLVAGPPLAAAFAPGPEVAEQIRAVTPAIAAFAVASAWLWVVDGVVLGQLRLRRMALSTAVGGALALAVLALVPRWGWGLPGVWLAVGVMILSRLGVLVWGGLQRPAPGLG